MRTTLSLCGLAAASVGLSALLTPSPDAVSMLLLAAGLSLFAGVAFALGRWSAGRPQG